MQEWAPSAINFGNPADQRYAHLVLVEIVKTNYREPSGRKNLPLTPADPAGVRAPLAFSADGVCFGFRSGKF